MSQNHSTVLSATNCQSNAITVNDALIKKEPINEESAAAHILNLDSLKTKSEILNKAAVAVTVTNTSTSVTSINSSSTLKKETANSGNRYLSSSTAAKNENKKIVSMTNNIGKIVGHIISISDDSRSDDEINIKDHRRDSVPKNTKQSAASETKPFTVNKSKYMKKGHKSVATASNSSNRSATPKPSKPAPGTMPIDPLSIDKEEDDDVDVAKIMNEIKSLEVHFTCGLKFFFISLCAYFFLNAEKVNVENSWKAKYLILKFILEKKEKKPRATVTQFNSAKG